MKHIAVLGEGAWGTAIATVLAHNGHHVKLWCYYKELAAIINETRYNKRFLPDILLDNRITAVSSLHEVITDVDWIFEAIPIKFLRAIVQQVKPLMNRQQRWVILSKGIEQGTLLLPTQIIYEEMGYHVPVTILAGPSFAMDVAQQQLTGIALAASDMNEAMSLQQLIANDYFLPSLTTDTIGVQLGAALKNVITIGIGMLDGAGYSDTTKAFILTRGLDEMVNLSTALGGKSETIYGLAGIGDLALTVMGKQSRNLYVGQQMGMGKSLTTIVQTMKAEAEGINTVQSVYQLLQREQLSLPLCRGIYEVMFMHKKIKDFLYDTVMYQ